MLMPGCQSAGCSDDAGQSVGCVASACGARGDRGWWREDSDVGLLEGDVGWTGMMDGG